jgi:hypothetical protein
VGDITKEEDQKIMKLMAEAAKKSLGKCKHGNTPLCRLCWDETLKKIDNWERRFPCWSLVAHSKRDAVRAASIGTENALFEGLLHLCTGSVGYVDGQWVCNRCGRRVS